MKALFLLLELLTDRDTVQNILQSCFTAAMVSVVVLFLLGAYQVVRRTCARRNAASPSLI
jgi:hypothetical protein